MTFMEQFIHAGGQREDCACLGHGGGHDKMHDGSSQDAADTLDLCATSSIPSEESESTLRSRFNTIRDDVRQQTESGRTEGVWVQGVRVCGTTVPEEGRSSMRKESKEFLRVCDKRKCRPCGRAEQSRRNAAGTFDEGQPFFKESTDKFDYVESGYRDDSGGYDFDDDGADRDAELLIVPGIILA